MQGEELRGLAVVSVRQAEKLGTVDDLLVDVSNHRMAALLLQGGVFREGPMVRWSDIHSLGPDAIMVDDSSAAVATANENHDVRLSDLRDTRVVGDNGELEGTVAGVDFDADSGKVTAYIVSPTDSSGKLQHGMRFLVQPEAIAAFGPKLITVTAALIDFKRTE